MQDMLTNLSTYGYIFLFLYSIGGGMVAIIAAGVLSYMGKMDLSISIIIATIANTLGDTILFYLARYNKSAVMPYFKNQKRKLAYAHLLVKKHGDKIVFLQKYIYGVKTLVPLAMGLTKYSFYKFSALNFMASVIWAGLIGCLSFWAGDFMQSAWEKFSGNGWVMPIFMMCLFGGLWIFLDKKTKRKA